MAPLLLTVLGCAGSCAAPAGVPSAAPAGALVPTACEASALVWTGSDWLIGDNETKDRLLGMDTQGRGAAGRVLGAEVDDIEALVPGPEGRVWVVGSQGNKKDGTPDPERRRILWTGGGAAGVPDLSGCAPCAAAAARAPEAGGVNVEGALVADGVLWLGLRSPLVDGKALLLALDVPADAPAPPTPTVTRSVLVDLGGRGIRDATPAPQGGHYLVAGPAGSGDDTLELYHLAHPDGPARRVPVVLPAHAEGVSVGPDGSLVWVTDGDGKKGKCGTPSTWGTISLPAPAGP